MGEPPKLGGEGVLMPELSQSGKGRVLPGSRKDADAWEGFRYSENCKKLSMGRDRGEKGLVPK